MKKNIKQPENISKYIESFPPEIQEKLIKLRKTIQESAPDATEKISYQMPTFYLKGNLVHFAACKNHIGFYPAPSAIVKFNTELSIYETSKGAVKFFYDKPIPYQLISKMVKFRVKETLKKK